MAQLLEAREKRALRQRELLEQFPGTLISCTMNIPGPEKCNSRIRRVFTLGEELLLAQLRGERLSLLHREAAAHLTGCEGFYVVEADGLRVKELTVQAEDAYPWTRLLDIDVLTPAGEKLSREDLGLPPRRCLLCGGPAAVCARSRAHGLPALLERTEELLNGAIREADSRLCGELAVRALLYEVCTAPKPGLVDRLGPGSHRDMDIFTFMSSTAALQDYFTQCARYAMERRHDPAEALLPHLRLLGREAEARMYRATGGVNTHKGAIFTLGLLCAALGRLPRQDWGDTEALLSQCAAMTAGLSMTAPEDSRVETAGQRLYRELGAAGVRGQAKSGFPVVLQVGLPILRLGLALGLSPEEAGRCTLLHLLCTCGDTNMIKRGGMEQTQAIVELLKHMLKEEPFPPADALRALDESFAEKNLSPGGSADLLAASWLLYFAGEAAE